MTGDRRQPTDEEDEAVHIRRRSAMVELLRERGVTDEAVLGAMARVRRHRFVPSVMADEAYDDRALPIGSGQTISQPYMVAVMAEAADIGPDDRVAEIGTGSGYGAAVLALIAAEVHTIERRPELAHLAATRLRAEGFDNVTVVEGDGTVGIPDAAPFDAIVVTAAARLVPHNLLEQLVEGGRLVMPVGGRDTVQRLRRIRLAEGREHIEDLGGVRFVPLIAGRGDEGPTDDASRWGPPAT